MKKVLIYFALSAMLALTVSCNPTTYAWSWKIENTTSQNLKLEYYDLMSDTPQYKTHEIHSGRRINFYYYDQGQKSEPLKFKFYFERSESLSGGGAYWRLLSEDNEVLRTWRYSDRDLPGQRFFQEGSWKYISGGGGGLNTIAYYWVFDIMPEDIVLENVDTVE